MIYDAVIVGGGLSGLAAAVAITAGGGKVAVIEQAPKAGGRCYSYTDEVSGDVVDNGQHVLLGAYTSVLRYLQLIGTRDFLREQSTLVLPFHHPRHGHAQFRLARLPAPVHLTAGILRYGLLSLAERKGLLSAGLSLKTTGRKGIRKLESLTVDEWLGKLGQKENVRRCFWDPISVSVMNELPVRSSAFLFAGTIRRAFLGRHADSRMLIPTVGQTDLYVDGARRFLETGGSAVLLATTVKSINLTGGHADGIVLKNGTIVRGRSVVSAVPHHALPSLLPAGVRDSSEFRSIRKIDSSPIVSVNLWFDDDFMEGEILGLIGRTTQWIFNRRNILGRSSHAAGYLSGVISAARSVVGLPADRLVGIVTGDVRSVFPQARRARVIRSVVIKERRATFSPTPEAEALRPPAETGIRNFYLAGDWTATGLPATIEGAVLSGFTAAKLVCH